MRKKFNSEIYRDAAAIVAEGNPKAIYSFMTCLALKAIEDDCSDNGYKEHAAKYREMFAPRFNGDEKDGYWGGDCTRKNQLQRSIALLLMAEMADDGAI